MIQVNKKGIPSSNEVVTAIRKLSFAPKSYNFRRLQYPNICIPNRGAAWALSFKQDDSGEIIQLKRDVDSYNGYLDLLEHIDGFKEFFVSNGFFVSKEDICEHWSEKIAGKVFAKERYIFETDLKINGNYLIDVSIPTTYSVCIDGSVINLPIGKDASHYPTRVGKNKVIWNWTDNGHDFCYYLWDILGARYYENDEAAEDDNAVSYSFDVYEQFRDDAPEIQLVSIFSKLQYLGYIKTFTILPEVKDPRWNYFCKSDGTLDCAIIDISFLKNKLAMEQINLLLWTPSDELVAKPFFLTTGMNTQYLSAAPGTLGGHKKLKIYGKLDCPSATRYLAKGQYAKNRVFFIDEETAVAAGYRPCAVCMPVEYKKWKTKKQEENNNDADCKD